MPQVSDVPDRLVFLLAVCG